jgi:GxxExxY protein
MGITEGKRTELVLEEFTGRIIAAAVEVHRQPGPGFLESLYERALVIELGRRGIEYECQRRVRVSYCDQPIGDHVLDLIVEGKVAVELKAVKAFEDVHFAQLRSYRRATGAKVGLLINFNAVRLEVKRVINRHESLPCFPLFRASVIREPLH